MIFDLLRRNTVEEITNYSKKVTIKYDCENSMKYRLAKCSLARGYISTKTFEVYEYKGRYGKGYIIAEHYNCRYVNLYYYVEK